MKYELKAIALEEWKMFFSSTSPYSLFQSWDWGDVQLKLGHTVKRFGLYQDDILIGIFQTDTVRAKRGAFLHVRHGPILNSQSEDIWRETTKLLKEVAKKENVLFFRVSPLIDTSYSSTLEKLGYRPAEIHAMDAEYCWVLSLSPTEEELLKNMRKTTRYEIKRSQTLGITVKQSTDIRDIDIFMNLYKETAARQGFIPHKGVEEEFDIFSKKGEAVLYSAWHENTCIASAIILFTGNQGIYHHGASITHKLPGSYAIQWEAIKEAKKRGLLYYNFWGIAPEGQEKHPWAGLTLFKKGFGGEAKQYMHAHDYPVSFFYIVPHSIEKLRKIKKGY